MNKKIIILFVALYTATCGVFAQQTTESPYSYYGVGELNSLGSVEEKMMGGIGVYADSTRVNLQNPAALSQLKFTAFSAGMTFQQKKIVSNITNVGTKATSFDYLVLGFPIVENLGLSVGLIPYSSVGYKLASKQTHNDVIYENQFEGNGNVNQGFASLGYKIYKGLSVGTSLKFNFGKTEMTDMLSVSNAQFLTQEYSKSLYKGVSTNLGLYYQSPLKNKLTISTSFVYTPESKLSSENERVISTYGYTYDTNQKNSILSLKEKQTKNLEAIGLKNTKLTMPSQFEVGFGIGEKQKWFVGLEYTYSDMGKFSNPFLSTTNVTYEGGYKFSLGGFYLPKYNSYSSYWNRVTYRAGFRYEKTGIMLNNQSVNDFGISFGASLPVRGFSNITAGVEYGQKGTLKQNLIKENYFNFKVGFTLNDKWFQRTKYQ